MYGEYFQLLKNHYGIMIIKFFFDIVIIADNDEELKLMILELEEVAKQIALNMNINKIKVMCKEDPEIKLEGQ